MPETEMIAEDINREVKYIYDRMTKMTLDSGLFTYEDLVKEKIGKLLHFMRREYLDLPMIERYRKYDYGPTLTDEHVWMVASLDQEYGKFRIQFNHTREFLEKLIST